MKRDNNYYDTEKMGTNRRQNDLIKQVAIEVGISEKELSDTIHSSKKKWCEGDYTYRQLRNIAYEMKRKKSM